MACLKVQEPKIWMQVERWGEGMFLLDAKGSWNHWKVWRSVVYSVCGVKNEVEALSAGRWNREACTGDLSELRWLIKVNFCQSWGRRKWRVWWTSGGWMQEARHWRKEASLAPGFLESLLCQDFLLWKPQTMALNTTSEYISAALISHLSSWIYLTE